jgi:hypothetical protein
LPIWKKPYPSESFESGTQERKKKEYTKHDDKRARQFERWALFEDNPGFLWGRLAVGWHNPPLFATLLGVF